MSQTNSQGAQWPPRSPHDVLMSTPKGRERLRRLAERTSPSPSPTRKSISTPSLENRTKRLLASSIGLGALSDPEKEEEEEEDEETLQLQLQEIQARLKLKRLQKKAAQTSEVENKDNDRRTVPPEMARSAAGMYTQSKPVETREQQRERSQSQAGVHVPASPIKRLQPTEAPRSPSRVLLGIDKGWKGSDVSLRKAPSLRRDDSIGSQTARNAGPYLHRSRSQASIYGNQDSRSSLRQDEVPKPKSFSERIAAMRAEEAARREKEARAKKNRSTAFDITQEEMEQYKNTAITLPETPYQPPEFSREEVLASFNKTSTSGPSHSRALSSPHPSVGSSDISIAKSTTETIINLAKRSTSRRSTRKPAEFPETEATQFEPYSSQHLSKRILPHQVVTRTFSGKKTYVVPDLLKVVKAPDYNPPEIEDDWVLLGVVAWKSEPKSKQDGSKYLVIKVTDLKWELDLFLFDSAFTRFWKLTIGTVIAILNPTIWAPPKGKIDTGHFSLTLNSSEDTILEIGSSRDLGFCKSVKKDGKECGSWVDKRHTEFCDFHVNIVLDKAKSKRPEVNSMDFGRGPKYGDRKHQRSQDMTWYMKNKEEDKAYTKTHGTYDRGVQSHFFIAGRTPANLLDDVDYDPDAFHRGISKEERLRKQLITQERERELARKLGETGTGAGAVYLRSREKQSNPNPSTSSTTSEPTENPSQTRNASSLGLLRSRGSAASIHLSPMKRKRALTGGNGVDSASSSFSSTASTAVANSSTTTATATTTAPLGWGSNLAKELNRMKNGESLSQQQPVKKKTRFVTEKGIREAGRDSFGGEVVGKASITSIASAATASSSTSSVTKTIRRKPAVVATPDDDDSNDDLDIIR